jgi:Family of unknown function (DUF6491)
MSKFILAAAVAVTALATGCATEPDAAAEAPVSYAVVDDDARIAFASTIRNFRVGKDSPRSLLIEAGNGKWYRVALQQYCARDLPWEHAVGIDTGPGSTFDRFSTVVVDGRRCQVKAIDEIVDPDDAPAPAAAQPSP